MRKTLIPWATLTALVLAQGAMAQPSQRTISPGGRWSGTTT